MTSNDRGINRQEATCSVELSLHSQPKHVTVQVELCVTMWLLTIDSLGQANW